MTFGSPRCIDVKYDAEAVRAMLRLLEASPMPEKTSIDAHEPWKLGMEIDYLKKLREMFLTEWSWDVLEKKITKFDNYVVHYERDGYSMDLHYVHVRSKRTDAIPLILCHGWPGTSRYLPLIFYWEI